MGKVILIVEDEPKSLKLIRDLLQVSGHTTLEATDGKQGVALARQNKPDLILMNIQMPVLDGIEAMRILKADDETKALPIIALTSYTMKGNEEEIWESGCDGYMPKPLDVKEFLRQVSKFLSR